MLMMHETVLCASWEVTAVVWPHLCGRRRAEEAVHGGLEVGAERVTGLERTK